MSRAAHKKYFFRNMNSFQLISSYQPTGDQPEAIRQLADGLVSGATDQTLLGVTGSGKTFTIANVIAQVGKPTLVLSHNKTLAAQLYGEFKQFFPNNAVEYYVSYYDYYQPEAYLAATDTYIEKDFAINQEIDRLRLAATSQLLSGRRDVVVVSSVSCIYGMGNPAAFYENVIELRVGQTDITREQLLQKLVASQYARNDVAPTLGNFRVRGDTVDIFLAYASSIIRVSYWGDEVESIAEVDADSGHTLARYEHYNVYPANLFLTTPGTQDRAIAQILNDLHERENYFESIGKHLEAQRLHERVTYDLEMIRELGHCSGIENYSRYFDGRAPGERPYCLLDFFPKNDFLVVIDESHVSIPQLSAMYGGDRARKQSLVDYGFRLPAALDNRPLQLSEFQALTPQVIYVSATPADYELERSGGVVVEQLIRPTGLLDPPIEVRPSLHQVDDLMNEVQQRREAGERVLVTTLTKRMAEELTQYLLDQGISTSYIHSDVSTLDRVRIMDDFRAGTYDVLVGVNLLREGLDLPEVSLVAIFDADKEGFLRSHRALTQMAGRAARNVNGLVIFYADAITPSMQQTIDETLRRRTLQLKYNEQHGITPQAIQKPKRPSALTTAVPESEGADGGRRTTSRTYAVPSPADEAKVAEPQTTYGTPAQKSLSTDELRRRAETVHKRMQEAARALDFVSAAALRDEWLRLQVDLEERTAGAKQAQ